MEMQNLQLGVINPVRYRHGDLDGHQQRAVRTGLHRVPQGEVHLHIIPVSVGNLQLLGRIGEGERRRRGQVLGIESGSGYRDQFGVHIHLIGAVHLHLGRQPQTLLQLFQRLGHTGTILIR